MNQNFTSKIYSDDMRGSSEPNKLIYASGFFFLFSDCLNFSYRNSGSLWLTALFVRSVLSMFQRQSLARNPIKQGESIEGIPPCLCDQSSLRCGSQ